LATITALIKQYFTPPSIRDTVDSVESAIIAINVSNKALLHTPLSEKCQWPSALSEVPSGDTLIKMGVSGAVMSQGKSISFERDPKTGLPRPTSPLYLMLKGKEKVLKEAKAPRRNFHKNALYAFGAVSLNNKEIKEIERDLAFNEKGYRKCEGLIRSDSKSFERGIKEGYCESKALKVMQIDPNIKAHRDSLKKEGELARKKFAPLARNVSRVSLAGMDYLAAALVEMTGTIVKMPSAINQANKEFRQLPPHEVAMMVSRLESIKRIAPYFPQYMSDHISIYKTLYSVLRDEYPDSIESGEKRAAQQVLERVKAVETAYEGVREKIAALGRGEEVHFTTDESRKWDRLATLFTSEYQHLHKSEPDPQMMIALNFEARRSLFVEEEIQP
jgi:hypothetical protein